MLSYLLRSLSERERARRTLTKQVTLNYKPILQKVCFGAAKFKIAPSWHDLHLTCKVIDQKPSILPYGLTTLAEFIYPEIAQEQFLGK